MPEDEMTEIICRWQAKQLARIARQTEARLAAIDAVFDRFDAAMAKVAGV